MFKDKFKVKYKVKVKVKVKFKVKVKVKVKVQGKVLCYGQGKIFKQGKEQKQRQQKNIIRFSRNISDHMAPKKKKFDMRSSVSTPKHIALYHQALMIVILYINDQIPQ